MVKQVRRWVPARKVKERYNFSEMTLWRRVNRPDPLLPFPKPVYEGRRKLFDEAELDRYDESLLAGAA
ncbi:DNA-binding protein [Mesorhizobium sangaii]|uniref:DNA-binding protein n=1 Tax=Mesorhizobium sangaii TaxID=505389 RepID=A0A841PTP3_9HYPH|nr:DNA-binding protein [Mesorhizobium sangaii]MBB6413519.1 hypothetical protein [Mesorhizobium sangaii]